MGVFVTTEQIAAMNGVSLLDAFLIISIGLCQQAFSGRMRVCCCRSDSLIKLSYRNIDMNCLINSLSRTLGHGRMDIFSCNTGS